ncbi:MAG: peptidylprolyl isomerase [Psychrobium sp.]|nr:peptidylprolyl isomerase [Psychrobium sp.]
MFTTHKILKNITKKLPLLLALASFSMLSNVAQATIVEFDTSQGKIKVNLYDNLTPKTVANFMQYVEDSSYNQTIIHRSVNNFIVQGGAYFLDGDTLEKIDTNGTVINEPIFSNIKGTIAMAKLSGGADSATSQWFFNLGNNSGNLDLQNGGFTVFGHVIAGMDVIEKIANLTTCGSTPVVDFSVDSCKAGIKPTFENYVSITNVDIPDSTVDTLNGYTPVKNTLLTSSNGGGSGGGGGSIGWLAFFAMMLVTLRRRFST